jgi:hypothetical protein
MAVLSHHAMDVQNLPSLYDEAFMLVITTVVVASLGWRLLAQLATPTHAPGQEQTT